MITVYAAKGTYKGTYVIFLTHLIKQTRTQTFRKNEHLTLTKSGPYTKFCCMRLKLILDTFKIAGFI